MSCKTKGGPAFLGVETDVKCPAKCILRPGEDAPHTVKLKNYGPLEVRVETDGKCGGPLLLYEDGQPHWTVAQPVGRKRKVGEQRRSRAIRLAGTADPGQHGAYEQVTLEVKRARGVDDWENPTVLLLELELKR